MMKFEDINPILASSVAMMMMATDGDQIGEVVEAFTTAITGDCDHVHIGLRRQQATVAATLVQLGLEAVGNLAKDSEGGARAILNRDAIRRALDKGVKGKTEVDADSLLELIKQEIAADCQARGDVEGVAHGD